MLGRREESRGGAWSSSQTKLQPQLCAGYFTSGMPPTLPSGSRAFLLLSNFWKPLPRPPPLQPTVTLGLGNCARLLHQGFVHFIRVRIRGGLLNKRMPEPVPEFWMQWVWEAPRPRLPSEFPGAAAGLGTTLGEPALLSSSCLSLRSSHRGLTFSLPTPGAPWRWVQVLIITVPHFCTHRGSAPHFGPLPRKMLSEATQTYNSAYA